VNGRSLLNFASTNYLNLNQHPQVLKAVVRGMRRWGTSLSMPRVLATDHLTSHLEQAIVRLVGQDKTLVFPSTTHIALDVIPILAGPQGAIFVDAWAYPISLEGVYAAARRGGHVFRFPHNDYRALARLLEANARVAKKVVVCDGVYAAGGHPAALHEFGRLARRFDAIVYVDDAHGTGVLGENPTRQMPYGRGGGGTLLHCAVPPGKLVHVGSLAKAFGVPVAFVAGPESFIDQLQVTAATYTHSSPPAIPVLASALGVLGVHSVAGEAQRQHLLSCTGRFRQQMRTAGIDLLPDQLFPIQTLYLPTPRAAATIGQKLWRHGIWSVLQFRPPDHPTGGVLRFVLTTHHTKADIDEVTKALAHCVNQDRLVPAFGAGHDRAGLA